MLQRTTHDTVLLASLLFRGLPAPSPLRILGNTALFWVRQMYTLVCLVGTLNFNIFVLCRYIVFDTSRLIHRFEPDEYVHAAIQLYLDILNLFLYILRILSKLQKK